MPSKRDLVAPARPAILPLLAGAGLVVLGTGLQGTLLGVRAGREGMSERHVGMMMSAFFLGHVVGSIWCPGWVARIGHIRTFASLASRQRGGLFVFTTGVWTGFVAFGVYRLTQRSAIPAVLKRAFVVMPGMTHGAARLDPHRVERAERLSPAPRSEEAAPQQPRQRDEAA